MRYVGWMLKIAVFLIVLSFAVKNTDIVNVRYFLGLEWRVPLVLVLLVVFCLGAAAGVLASVLRLLRQRREIVNLKRELRARSRGPGADGAGLPR